MLPSMPILLAASRDSIAPADDDVPTKEVQLSQKEEKTLNIIQAPNDVPSFSFGSILEDERECDDELVLMAENASAGEKRKISSQPATTRKKKKITAVEPLAEDRANNDEQANHFATSYLMKAKSELDETTFSKFIALLSDVEESKTNVISLYSEMMKVLSNYPDLAEEFIGFLHPHQALEVEKFSNYIQFEHTWNFFRKIDAFHLNKVQHLLQQHLSNPSVTSEAVKNSLLSTFKGHPNISEGLLFLLPDEKPPASCKEDFDDISELGIEDSGKWERLTIPEQAHAGCSPATCDCTCHRSLTSKFCTFCNIKFWNGQIYAKTGKGLRFVKVTFLDSQQEEVLWRLNPAIYSKPVERKRTRSLSNPPKDSGHAGEPLIKGDPLSDIIKSKGLDRTEMCNEVNAASRVDQAIDEAGVELMLPLVHCDEQVIKCINEGVILEEMTPSQMSAVLKNAMETERVAIITDVKQEDVTEASEKVIVDVTMESGEIKESAIESSSCAEINDQIVCEIEKVLKGEEEETENKNVHIKSEEEKGEGLTEAKKPQVWTREEDKLILQAFQKQLSSDQTFSTICELLPSRTVDDIQGRFQVLMNLLEQMTAGSSHPS